MTKSTRTIITGVIMVAILIAGWAFFRDQRLKTMTPAVNTASPLEGSTTETSLDTAGSDIDADLQSIDADLKQLDEDNTNADDTMPAPSNESDAAITK